MECYYPNGEQGDGLTPCNSTAAVSHCCRQGDICVTNGFCFSTGLNALVRRGCTDKTFNSTQCPQQCSKGENFQSADVVLIPCDTYTSFCCGQDQAARNCCSTGTGTVRVPAGSAMLSLAAGDGSPAATSLIVSTALVSITASATSCASTSTSTALGSGVGNCSTEKNATIGVAVGLGCAVAGVLFLLYLWRDAKKRINELTKPPMRDIPLE